MISSLGRDAQTHWAQITKLELMPSTVESRAVEFLMPSRAACGLWKVLHGDGKPMSYLAQLRLHIPYDSTVLLGNPGVSCGQDIWMPAPGRGSYRSLRGHMWRCSLFFREVEAIWGPSLREWRGTWSTRECHKAAQQDWMHVSQHKENLKPECWVKQWDREWGAWCNGICVHWKHLHTRQ